MAAIDKENFEDTMNEEMKKCFDNNVYEIIKLPFVPELKIIIRAICSHMRKKLLMAKYIDMDLESAQMAAHRNFA